MSIPHLDVLRYNPSDSHISSAPLSDSSDAPAHMLFDSNEVYLMYGFKDYSSFFRAFKKEYGISPKEFREMNSVDVNEFTNKI